MIKFAVVHRAKDGLALSASTDLDSEVVKLRESKRYAKLLSRKARQFPVRSAMLVGGFRIFFTTESDICFLLICELNYQPVLAYSFLDDLKKEFLKRYTKGAVEKAIRPYSFIEFDNYILKTKQKYNNTRTLYTRLDISTINEELKSNPPYEVQERDLTHSSSASLTNNGRLYPSALSFGTPSHGTSTKSSGKFNILPPLTSLALFSIILTGLCGILNLIRLVPYVSEHAVDEQDEQNHWFVISLCFLCSVVINLLQIYILFYPMSGRSYVNWLLLLLSVLLLYSLSDLRNMTQVLFHLAASVLITYNIWKRPMHDKLPNYNV